MRPLRCGPQHGGRRSPVRSSTSPSCAATRSWKLTGCRLICPLVPWSLVFEPRARKTKDQGPRTKDHYPREIQMTTISPQKMAANRRNAQKSTGPRSAAGKSRARFNALKHGVTAQIPVLPGEDPALFHAPPRRVQRRSPAQVRAGERVDRADGPDVLCSSTGPRRLTWAGWPSASQTGPAAAAHASGTRSGRAGRAVVL